MITRRGLFAALGLTTVVLPTKASAPAPPCNYPVWTGFGIRPCKKDEGHEGDHGKVIL